MYMYDPQNCLASTYPGPGPIGTAQVLAALILFYSSLDQMPQGLEFRVCRAS